MAQWERRAKSDRDVRKCVESIDQLPKLNIIIQYGKDVFQTTTSYIFISWLGKT